MAGMEASSAPLREIAEWNRKLAVLAITEDERQSQLRFAEYLEKQAAQKERQPNELGDAAVA
jgi:hypothetical protein